MKSRQINKYQVMDNALLFENFITDNLFDCSKWGASMYNGCLSETESYANGVKVGKIYILLDYAKENLRSKLSNEKREILDASWNKVSPTPSFDELDEFLSSLHENMIIY